MIHGALRIVWQHEDWWLLPGRALLQVASRSLIIADWHVGKDSHLRRAGIALPQGGLAQELARLEQLIAASEARELIVLGDLSHAEIPSDDPALPALREWRTRQARLRWRVVLGNHDRRLGPLADLCDEIAVSLHLGALHCLHDPADAGAAPALCGHVHPVLQLREGRFRVRVPVFEFQPDRALLPAFGAYTGGFLLRAQPAARYYAALEDRVLSLAQQQS